MRRHAFVMVAVFAIPFVARVRAASEFDGNYGVVTERNMFMRERHRPRPINRTPSSRPDATSPQAVDRSTVLRGVAIEDDELHAYVENTRTGAYTRLTVGDTIAGGRVINIAIDAIDYEADGHSAWVEVGQNLSGARVAAGPPTEATTQPAAGSASTALPPGGGTLEERMRARRAAQQGRR